MDFGSSVSKVAWRPGYESCLATCAGAGNDYKIHVWDGDRPFLPLRSFKAGLPRERRGAKPAAGASPEEETDTSAAALTAEVDGASGHTDDVTGLLWLDEGRLVSASKDGTVRIHELAQSYRPYCGISTVAIAWSPLGEIAKAGAPIVRDWKPKRDHASKEQKKKEKRKKDQERRGKQDQDDLALAAGGSRQEREAAAAKQDSGRDSASGRWRRGFQQMQSGFTGGAVPSAAGSAPAPLAIAPLGIATRDRSANDEVVSPAGSDGDSRRSDSRSPRHRREGAPPLDPATTAVEWAAIRDLGDVLTSPAPALPDGSWAEEPYGLGYNPALFEHLAKEYTMTPIFKSAPRSSGRGGTQIRTSSGQGSTSGTPRAASQTAGSPRGTPRAAAGKGGTPRAGGGGTGWTPPPSPTRGAGNAGSAQAAVAAGMADTASVQMIVLSLGRIDKQVERSLGLTANTSTASPSTKSQLSASLVAVSTETEQRAAECLRLGDIAVRDEDELEKAVRWYIGGLAALCSAVANSGGGGGSTAGKLLTPSTGNSPVVDVLRARLDGRLSWARRRHRRGVAEAVRLNAAVAGGAGQAELANCWQMLQALVTPPTAPRGDGLDEDDEKEDESSMHRNHSASLDRDNIAEQIDRAGLLDGVFGATVERLASWFATRRGEADVQSAVTLLLLVGRPYMWEAVTAIHDLWPPHNPAEDDKAGGPPHPSSFQRLGSSSREKTAEAWTGRSFSARKEKDNASQQQKQAGRALIWCHAYVEILQRHKLDTLAIRVGHLSQCTAIQKVNQDRVVFQAASKCLKCKAQMPQAPGSQAGEAGSHCNSPACTKDFKLGFVNARCGVCRLPVRGPWVWCQGCGHGGHLHCYEGWFGDGTPQPPQRRLCPTGCNHLCNMVLDEQ